MLVTNTNIRRACARHPRLGMAPLEGVKGEVITVKRYYRRRDALLNRSDEWGARQRDCRSK